MRVEWSERLTGDNNFTSGIKYMCKGRNLNPFVKFSSLLLLRNSLVKCREKNIAQLTLISLDSQRWTSSCLYFFFSTLINLSVYWIQPPWCLDHNHKYVTHECVWRARSERQRKRRCRVKWSTHRACSMPRIEQRA